MYPGVTRRILAISHGRIGPFRPSIRMILSSTFVGLIILKTRTARAAVADCLLRPQPYPTHLALYLPLINRPAGRLLLKGPGPALLPGPVVVPVALPHYSPLGGAEPKEIRRLGP